MEHLTSREQLIPGAVFFHPDRKIGFEVVALSGDRISLTSSDSIVFDELDSGAIYTAGYVSALPFPKFPTLTLITKDTTDGQ